MSARPAPHNPDPLVIAVPKGRVLKVLVPLLERAGLDTEPLTREGRALVRKTADGTLAYLLLKPGDIPTYVEAGAATLGVVGRDVLREYGGSLYVPVDLGIGRCQMCVCAPEDEGERVLQRTELRVATKFPNVARAHFAARGVRAETIYLGGSVELAPITGLADVIVDIVETGRTLRENGLVPVETIFEVSTVVIANPVGLKLQHAVVAPLLDRLRLHTQPPGSVALRSTAVASTASNQSDHPAREVRNTELNPISALRQRLVSPPPAVISDDGE